MIAGLQLSSWVRSRGDLNLDEAQIDAAWNRISDHLSRRDRVDLERFGPPPRTITAVIVDLLQFPAGIVAGTVVGGSLLRIVGWPGFILPELAFGGAAALAMRLRRVHRFAAGAFVAIGVIVAVLVIATAASFLGT